MTSPRTAAVALPPHKSFFSVPVLRVRHWNAHLFSFAVERPASLRFRSGEFIMLGLNVAGRPLLRAYSIASPAWAEELEFLSIKVPDGPLTSHLQAIAPGDDIYLGRKPTGTLVADALLPGRRLFLFATGTGLAPFLSIVRDPEVYDRFAQIILVHSVRNVDELAFHDELAAQLADDPLVRDQALLQFHYVPTVTREPFHTQGRIGALIDSGALFRHPVTGPAHLDPACDRVMLCGSTAMIREFQDRLTGLGYVEGAVSRPGQFVIERAFVD
jgi:ferredoxin--NADP+ reductase